MMMNNITIDGYANYLKATKYGVGFSLAFYTASKDGQKSEPGYIQVFANGNLNIKDGDAVRVMGKLGSSVNPNTNQRSLKITNAEVFVKPAQERKGNGNYGYGTRSNGGNGNYNNRGGGYPQRPQQVPQPQAEFDPYEPNYDTGAINFSDM